MTTDERRAYNREQKRAKRRALDVEFADNFASAVADKIASAHADKIASAVADKTVSAVLENLRAVNSNFYSQPDRAGLGIGARERTLSADADTNGAADADRNNGADADTFTDDERDEYQQRVRTIREQLAEQRERRDLL